LQKLSPCRCARQRAADMARGFFIGVHFGVGVEVLDARQAQQKTRGFDAGRIRMH